ncbi:hypothetical protein [Curvivirga aplysinae]|uniref:hypothetical protein n=1 Tax=Curvivirga aplysinae TaxID=2529852 RepID=UPI0012BD35C4|nr:hypothetical protein [Curvivirga aplysinae]MTI09040.1 hypothetical protein [Curvivirga aplysinae]
MKKLIVFGLLLTVTACANSPSITNSDNVKEIPDGYEAVSVCHSGEPTEKKEIEQLALAECPIGARNVHPWDFDWFMNGCPLTKRKRITFLCTQ